MKRFFSKKSVDSPKEKLDSDSDFLKGEISKVENSEVIPQLDQHIVLLPGEDFEDPVTSFTKRVNETFIAVERHIKYSDKQNKKSTFDVSNDNSSTINNKMHPTDTNMKEAPLLLTDQALYLLHINFDKVSFKKNGSEQNVTIQDSINWFKGFYSKKWKGSSKNNNSPIIIKNETQSVLNDLFTAMYVLPKWRMSFFYIESIRVENDYWYLNYFSGDQKDKLNSQTKENVGRVSRKYKVQDLDKILSWSETFKSVLRAYWMKKWEEIGILDPNDTNSKDIFQYHAWVHKINRKGLEQYRCILLTVNHMYLINTGPGEQLTSAPTVRWKVGISCLKELRFYPEESSVIGFVFDKTSSKKFSKKVHTSYDLRCSDEYARNTHAVEICRLYYISTGNSLKITEKKGKPTGSNK